MGRLGSQRVPPQQLVGVQEPRASEWTEIASADNAVATATRVAEAGKRHYITGIVGSFSTAAIKLLELKINAVVELELYVHDSGGAVFPSPIEAGENQAVSLVLAASGTATVLGKVAMIGFTLDA